MNIFYRIEIGLGLLQSKLCVFKKTNACTSVPCDGLHKKYQIMRSSGEKCANYVEISAVNKTDNKTFPTTVKQKAH